MEAVIEVKPIQSGKSLKAVADFTLTTDEGEITITKIRVIQDGSSPPWVALPQESYQKNGETKYSPVIVTSKKFKRWLDEKVLEQYRALPTV